MIPIVCFSHSSYDDVLRVQLDFLQRIECVKYLCYDKDTIIPGVTVIVYDESAPYSKRLAQCLPHIPHDFFLFLHDTDIVTSADMVALTALTQYSLDRIDLRTTENQHQSVFVNDELSLERVTTGYIYNVGPSIWKRSFMIELMNTFNKCYRTIEENDVQEYCKCRDMYILHSKTSIPTAFFTVSNLFVYIHITSVGKLIPREGNMLCNELQEIYNAILAKYVFHRGMKKALYGFD